MTTEKKSAATVPTYRYRVELRLSRPTSDGGWDERREIKESDHPNFDACVKHWRRLCQSHGWHVYVKYDEAWDHNINPIAPSERPEAYRDPQDRFDDGIQPGVFEEPDDFLGESDTDAEQLETAMSNREPSNTVARDAQGRFLKKGSE